MRETDKIKNLKEFKELIKRYESISKEEIIECYTGELSASLLKERLTGFGTRLSCTLCVSSKGDFPLNTCQGCVYTHLTPAGLDIDLSCLKGENEKTYFAIDDAMLVEELHKAYKKRAQQMRTILLRNGIEPE